MTGLWIILGISIFVVIWFIGAYNSLIRSKTSCETAWADIDVQLKRRHDLIPNLVNVAKKYVQHEKDTLESVIKARQQAIDAKSLQDRIEAENMLTSTLRSLFAVSENYPDLKADTVMKDLSENLVSTENRIAFARQHYNSTVRTYRIKLQSIPTNLIAGMFAATFQLDEFPYFEADEEERENVKVEFE
ncbi:MAG: LemA family protein [Planctomycetota bacterium]|nr:MAG: LemA family protein [Planctomycetota bacterium]